MRMILGILVAAVVAFLVALCSRDTQAQQIAGSPTHDWQRQKAQAEYEYTKELLRQQRLDAYCDNKRFSFYWVGLAKKLPEICKTPDLDAEFGK